MIKRWYAQEQSSTIYDDVKLQSGSTTRNQKTIVKISSLYLHRLQKPTVSSSQVELFYFDCRIKLNDRVNSWNSYKAGLVLACYKAVLSVVTQRSSPQSMLMTSMLMLMTSEVNCTIATFQNVSYSARLQLLTVFRTSIIVFLVTFLVCGFLVGFSFLYFMFLLPSFLYVYIY